jgi:hypothetical protein
MRKANDSEEKAREWRSLTGTLCLFKIPPRINWSHRQPILGIVTPKNGILCASVFVFAAVIAKPKEPANNQRWP